MDPHTMEQRLEDKHLCLPTVGAITTETESLNHEYFALDCKGLEQFIGVLS